jgi:aminoglycoside 6'-N-acetyltransferase
MLGSVVRVDGELVVLREAGDADVATIVAIRSTPEVVARWGAHDAEREVRESMVDADLHYLAIEDRVTGTVVGVVQWAEETEPDYRHATIDIFLDPSIHGRGVGTDAIRALVRHLVEVEGHHRLTIDPAADNAVAIACYAKVGFRPVGVMRDHERGPDGSWHDGLLMELLARDLLD